jgi:hypothetical protein
LCFTDNATNFTLSSAGGTATGTNRFGSCVLTVVTSTYGADAGPQEGEVITLEPCDFNSDLKTLTVSNRNLTATSMVAVACSPEGVENVHQATASDVNNQRFDFESGEVFHSGLKNIATALAFTDSATKFSLTSATGAASGTNTFGSCILRVTASNYLVGDGPQANSTITLNPCNFDSTTKKLTVSNGVVTATSAQAVVLTP